MKRIPIILIPALLCWLQFGFAQTPTAVAEKQDPLQDSVKKYQNIGLYKKVLPFAEQWVEKLKKEKRESSADYGWALRSLGNALNQTGKSQEAEPILLQSLEIYKKALGENHPEVGASWFNLGICYVDIGNYPKAEQYYLKALEIRRKALGEDHPKVGSSLNSLGNLYSGMGNYLKAEPFYIEAIEIWKKALGQDHQDLGGPINNLGLLYQHMGNYPKAETYSLKALEIWKKARGQDHSDVGTSLNNLGLLYWEMGNYPKAETFSLKALEIRKKALGQDHPNVGGTLNNLGNIYSDMGDYPKAEPFYLEALEIFKKALGQDHPDVGASLNNLGILYKDMGNFSKAETYYLEDLEILKKSFGQDHPYVGGSLNNLGNLYRNMGNFPKAELFCQKALEVWKKALGQDHPDVGTSLYGLGFLYFDMGNYPKAEPFFLEALKIRKRGLGENHPEVKLSILFLASLHWHWGKPQKATPSFLEQQKITRRLIQNYFPFWSDAEKEKFYESGIISPNEIFQSFCADQYATNPQLSSEAFNSLLFSKGLLLSNSSKWKQRIRNTKDSLLKARFEAWEVLVNRNGKLISSTDSTELVQLKTLQEEAQTKEKELVQKSEAFATLTDKRIYTWKDVQAKLKPGEAAVEMVRVRKKGTEKIVTDTSDQKKPTYYVKGLSDTAFYAAYIVKPGIQNPEMVLLQNGNALEDRWIQVYKNSMKAKIQDQTSYNQFWKKIDAKLGPSVKRVYFSPDGVYNSINLNTLQNPKTGKYLLEEKDIRLVTNTKDIVTASVSKPNPAYACLVGFPDYNTDKDKRAAVFQRERTSPEAWYNLNLTRGDAFGELPATKTEIENISGLMQTKGWQVESLLGENALEESIKAVQKPRVLHIATHGFFQPDTTKGSNPLIHSGLLLTGANKTLAGEKDDKVDDGILTAYEAMNLNLDNTDLVVLSACETGLGEIKNGEGVYGLQRAFKVAGAKSIIMSLWKVSDQATQELMVSFYKNWLGAEDTRPIRSSRPYRSFSKREAFLKAQKELKAKYPNPYYWGAFVMVGE